MDEKNNATSVVFFFLVLLFAESRKIKGMSIMSIQTVSQRLAPMQNTEQEMD